MGVRTIRSELVRAFARIHPLVRLFVLHPNRGKSYVVRTGVKLLAVTPLCSSMRIFPFRLPLSASIIRIPRSSRPRRGHVG